MKNRWLSKVKSAEGHHHAFCSATTFMRMHGSVSMICRWLHIHVDLDSDINRCMETRPHPNQQGVVLSGATPCCQRSKVMRLMRWMNIMRRAA